MTSRFPILSSIDPETSTSAPFSDEKLNAIIGKLDSANDMAWLSNANNNFNNENRLGKGGSMVNTLSKLVAIFENLELGKNRAEGDDLLGDAYESLMRHVATGSGKSKRQFYTPSEVTRVRRELVA